MDISTDIIEKAIILKGEGKMLLLRRSKTDTRRPLQWDLPGGLCEEGETLEEGVLREIVEETGLKVTGLRPIYTKSEIREWKTNKKNAVFIFYKAYVVSDKEVVVSDEHDEFRWLSLKDALELLDYYLHKDLLNYILDNKLAL